jgi:nucleotide-binding universal stress UspA family protein
LLVLFKNILVPYDGSSHSKHAFKVSLDMAKKYQSKLSMITVLNAPTGHGGSATLWDNALIGARNAVTKEFESFESTAKKDNISFHSEIVESNSITKAIVSFAKSKKFDLIVMGAHGTTGWTKLILGSVTEGVIRRVRCPVLIIR